MKLVITLAVLLTVAYEVKTDGLPETGVVHEEVLTPNVVPIENKEVSKRDVHYSCYRNGQRVSVGQTITDYNTCTEYRCERTDKDGYMYFQLKIVRGACGRLDGRCLYNGQRIEKECQTIQCYVDTHDNGRIQWYTKLVRGGCKSFDLRTCIAVNSTVEKNCHVYRCTHTDLGNGRFRWNLGLYRGSCGEVNGRCVYENQTVEENCATKTCIRYGNKIMAYHTAQTKCRDAYGRCHAPHTKFDYVYAGRIIRNCSCEINGRSIHYFCN